MQLTFKSLTNKDWLLSRPNIAWLISYPMTRFSNPDPKWSNLDIYDQYIEARRSEKYPPETFLETHHILPRHAGGGEKSSNKIILSVAHHTEAHYYRFLSYRQRGDDFAFSLRRNQKENCVKARQEFIVQINKEKGILFWDPKFQRKQGLKGGSKGGSANTDLQFAARQEIGKMYGVQVGKTRQSEKLKIYLASRLHWKHESGLVVETTPTDTFRDICNQLEL